MTVFNLGSINVDHFYDVPHLPEPGETLAATAHRTGLGGKGANQSVAVAKAGARIVHIGMIGPDGHWTREQLRESGVDVSHIADAAAPTAHAVITVDRTGENAIVIYPGANQEQSQTAIEDALAQAKEGDAFLLQNEVSLQREAAQIAMEKGLRVVYSAAPFEAEAVQAVLPFVHLLVMNELEAEQLITALGLGVQDLPVPNLLVTRGAQGSVWYDLMAGDTISVPAFPVNPVDTTGAGDCYIGYVAAGLDQGMERTQAMRLGSAAAAIKVMYPGAADAIPERATVDAFLAGIETI